MAELDTVVTFLCSSNLYWHKRIQGSEPGVVYDVRFQHRPLGNVQYDYTCTCKAFLFGKGKYCKHIEQAKSERCGWNGELEPTAQPDHGGPDNRPICPECGEDAEAMRVGV